MLTYSGSIAHVYIGTDGFVEGFAVGFVDPRAFYGKLKRSGLKPLVPIVLGMINKPTLCLKIFQNFKRMFSAERTESRKMQADTAELSSIAVRSAAKGLGSFLIDAFIKDAWSRKLVNITLTTNYEDNELVNNFYIKHRFTRDGLEVRKGRRLCCCLSTKG